MRNFLKFSGRGILFVVLTLGLMMTSCQRTQNASAEQIASQYGENPNDEALAQATAGTQDTTTAAGSQDDGRNRFGFGGNPDPSGMVRPLSRDESNYNPAEEKKSWIPGFKKEVETTVTETQKKIEAPKPPTAPPVDADTTPIVRLGFAEKISGDDLHVTLPGEYASVGKISIEKIDTSGVSQGTPWPRGTQMQIPNPRVSGGKIYFKVP